MASIQVSKDKRTKGKKSVVEKKNLYVPQDDAPAIVSFSEKTRGRRPFEVGEFSPDTRKNLSASNSQVSGQVPSTGKGNLSTKDKK